MKTSITKPFAWPAHVFKEYDIRGRAGEELDESFAYWLGRAFAEMMQNEGERKAVVAHDNRLSSPALHRALKNGLLDGGCDVVNIGLSTTPMFYYSLYNTDIACGMIVTASHNPGDENGFKIAMGKTTIYGERIQALRRAMERLSQKQAPPETARGREETLDFASAYIKMLKEKIQLGSRKLKVVVDCGNGTPSIVAPKVLKEWGCDVIPLYCESDPTFPNHHPDPVVPENLADLIQTVRKEQADVGIAFDGDGDRIGVVDETGTIRWGDQLMVLFWRDILKRHPGAEAPVEVKCSQALVEEIKRLGGKPFFHRTGHSHVKATLRRRPSIPFAGEMSGHLFFNDEFYGYDDALYAAGRLLCLLSHDKRPLSEWFADVPHYVATPETRVACPEEKKPLAIAAVKDRFAGRYPIIDVDGARIQFDEGWGLVRPSNTQPILVLRAEAKTEQALAEIKRQLADSLRALELHVNW
ncbi:phosphomannomutase [Geobacillus subterraneus]|uniref:Phosphomannomutase n=2 Tax=Geobacillus TaxID=129337 RepID=A0ABN4NQ55_9BACL|nr:MULTISPECIES: phosphomannomutase/phosphoglucomutase [Geobacillus]AMX84640.1 phosphomannomutase [Geobacillus subterraneus]KZS24842.1 phosphomannomutase [Geobacillus subterraneus]OXB85462.1 phosphomannomutase/phosphoglucomutase [Geobacillus uzenensis]QIZ66537.1 phosphomannomutase/phosphoglucomutase [Geobacillus subterraneus]